MDEFDGLVHEEAELDELVILARLEATARLGG